LEGSNYHLERWNFDLPFSGRLCARNKRFKPPRIGERAFNSNFLVAGSDRHPCRDFDLGTASLPASPGHFRLDPLLVLGGILANAREQDALSRAVFPNRLGEIRDRSFENQRYRASGLNLIVTAITLWNTVYMERALVALRSERPITDELVGHLSPLSWEHIQLTGDYVWHANKRVASLAISRRGLH